MNQSSPPIGHYYIHWLFLRALAIVYFFAFASLAVQITGLVGKDGVLPAANFLNHLADYIRTQGGGTAAATLPTIFWLNSSDFFLNAVCIAGMIFSALAFFGIASVFSFAMLWFLYLSLVNIGQDFLSFQWDILLLETGFLAIFLVPWQWLEAGFWKRAHLRAPLQPPIIIIWLLRWLLFRLMFESGFVKLASGDPTWHNLTALNYHYFTQPLPTPLAWYAAQLPDWFNKFSVLVVFAIELATPFMIFAGRKARFVAAIALVSFQILIAITGNYAFFNLLTIALCICLLDDRWIDNLLCRGRLHRPAGACNAPLQEEPEGTQNTGALTYVLDSAADPSGTCRPAAAGAPTVFNLNRCAIVSTATYAEPVGAKFMSPCSTDSRAQRIVSIIVAILIGILSIGATMRGTLGLPMPSFIESLFDISGRYFICNNYGLFAVMTTKRLEIQIEGSNDGIFWDAYEFKYKPGNLDKAPPIVAPQQPRLDWQMWFAALGDVHNNPWFVNLVFRLLQGEPTVLKLLANNPFPKAPPRYIRARLYDYRFTNEIERHKSGNWWKRELVGDYLPPIAIENQ